MTEETIITSPQHGAIVTTPLNVNVETPDVNVKIEQTGIADAAALQSQISALLSATISGLQSQISSLQSQVITLSAAIVSAGIEPAMLMESGLSAKISAMTAAATLTGAELLPAIQGTVTGANVKVTLDAIAAFCASTGDVLTTDVKYPSGQQLGDISNNLYLDTSGGDFYDGAGAPSGGLVGYYLGGNASGGPTWQLLAYPNGNGLTNDFNDLRLDTSGGTLRDCVGTTGSNGDVLAIDLISALPTWTAPFENISPASVSGSVSGTAAFSQPTRYAYGKRVLIYCSALVGTASYVFPVAFTDTPQVLSQNLAARVTTLTTSGVTVTGITSTGFIELSGY
jgi:hypothetical protein